jgi:hypothetical protein
MSDDYNQKDELERLKKDIEPHNLSKIVCEAIKNQVDINLAIQEIINKSLKDNVSTQNIVKDIISKHVRYMTWGWIVSTIGLLILAFIGGGYFK